MEAALIVNSNHQVWTHSSRGALVHGWLAATVWAAESTLATRIQRGSRKGLADVTTEAAGFLSISRVHASSFEINWKFRETKRDKIYWLVNTGFTNKTWFFFLFPPACIIFLSNVFSYNYIQRNSGLIIVFVILSPVAKTKAE